MTIRLEDRSARRCTHAVGMTFVQPIEDKYTNRPAHNLLGHTAPAQPSPARPSTAEENNTHLLGHTKAQLVLVILVTLPPMHLQQRREGEKLGSGQSPGWQGGR